VFSGIAALRYELAIVLPDDDDAARDVLAVALLSVVPVAVASVVAQEAIGAWLVGDVYQADLATWWWFVPAMVVVSGIYQSTLLWCTRGRWMRWMAVGQWGVPAATLAVQVVAWWLGWRSPSGLLAGTVAGYALVGGLLMVVVARREGGAMRKHWSWEQVQRAAVRFRMYPLYVVPYTLVGTVRDRFTYLLMTIHSPKADVGLFGVAARVVNLPNSVFSSALRPLFFSRAARVEFRTLQGSVLATLKILVLLVVPGWVVFLTFSDDIMVLVLGGEEWRPAGRYAVALSVPAVCLMVSNWLDRSFDVLGLQRLAMALEMGFSSTAMVGLALGVTYYGSIYAGIVLQSSVLAVCYIGWLFVVFRMGGMSLRPLAMLVGMSTMFVGVCYLALDGLRRMLPDPWAVGAFLLLSGALAAALGYKDLCALVSDRGSIRGGD
jgi:O-antigen/teichoic acid export membrane protein